MGEQLEVPLSLDCLFPPSRATVVVVGGGGQHVRGEGMERVALLSRRRTSVLGPWRNRLASESWTNR
ncbi:hypothetical protein VZT92_024199 [Zoarces viviparus]|uniref:Uncharacterized protein n=1 Tax=Zoarces viviparus TaxID=48416 RepID=A0AAW1E2A7_ZOAVI